MRSEHEHTLRGRKGRRSHTAVRGEGKGRLLQVTEQKKNEHEFASFCCEKSEQGAVKQDPKNGTQPQAHGTDSVLLG